MITVRDVQRHNRQLLAVYAYAYEFNNTPLVSDAEFDKLALTINAEISLNFYDSFWRNEFKPHTGSWIYNYPDLLGIADICNRILRL